LSGHSTGPDVAALAAILQDRTARIDERDDAAMYLGQCDDDAALTALLQIASDPAEHDLVVASCGESLARIFVRSGRLDPAWLHDLTPVALNEVIPWVGRERPDLLPVPNDWRLEDLADVDREGRLPLHYAAMANNVAEAEARLAEGDDPNCGDRLGFTPLHLTAQAGALETARLLLDHGAEVDRANHFGNTPLFVAVFDSRGRGELIALLRERGADPFLVNKSGQSPLGLARLIANYDAAQFFADL